MRRGIQTRAESEVQEGTEQKHVRKRDDIEHFWVAAGDVVRSHQIVRASHNAEDEHGAGESKSCKTKFAMNIRAIRCNKGRLRDEQKNPPSECGAVNVNDDAGERSPENSGEIVGA